MNISIGRKDGEPIGFEANADEKVLYAALRNRITVPYECASGTCGSCRAKLVSGELDDCWSDAPGKKVLKIRRGEFLMCQCVAKTDCEIRIPSPVLVKPQEETTPQAITGTIDDVEQITPDVRSFSISLDREVGFKAGQFMLLQLPGIQGARAYSMVNYSLNTKQLDFVIKHLKDGKCSQWLFDPPTNDPEVSLFGPLGHAVFEPHLEHDLLLLAGGSGIAGMMAMLEQADDIRYLDTYNIELIFGVRSVKDVFYLTALKRLAMKYPDCLRVTIALSEVDNQSEVKELVDSVSTVSKNLKIASSGFVHEHIEVSRTSANTMAFIAGPPPMVDASIRELVANCEIDVDRIRYDKFA